VDSEVSEINVPDKKKQTWLEKGWEKLMIIKRAVMELITV